MEKMMAGGGAARPAAKRYDFAHWSVEELRQFAEQMRVRDARTKSRRQLMELFGGSARR